HDNGAPEVGIPARPIFKPGIATVRGQITAELKKGAQAALKSKNPQKLLVTVLTRVGIIAVNSIKARISAGIPPSLAPSTIAGRIRRVKGAKRRARIQASLDGGTPASRIGGAAGVFTPLVVTGGLRNAITYVIRKVGRKLGRR